jgi:hypothetical protein
MTGDGAEGEEDEGQSRATKPPTPRLAAVEAAEQAQNLRVVGGGSSPAPEKEAAGEGENREIAGARRSAATAAAATHRW